LDDVVDKFVLVECTKTFRGKDKPLYFVNYMISSIRQGYPNIHKFLDKIIHIVVEDAPHVDVEDKPRNKTFQDCSIEYYQRDCIIRGLNECKDDDVILVGDVDEIPRSDFLTDIARLQFDKVHHYTFIMRYAYYYLNTFFPESWGGTVVAPYKEIKEHKPNWFRANRKHGQRMRQTGWTSSKGGWHFSHLVGNRSDRIDWIQNHMSISAHMELDTDDRRDPAYLEKCIRELTGYHKYSGSSAKMVTSPLSDLPRYVQENKELFKEYLYGHS
jgi:beta-1,4-mannosyl-glycoprotein beta-1,4-N-acetylglucosaminyltransferase